MPPLASRSFARAVDSRAEIERASLDLLAPLLPTRRGVRLLGVTLSALGTGVEGEGDQFALPF